jgi:predicted nucleic acid-binding protein
VAAYYLDTSALVKGYVQETGSIWVRSLINPAAGHELYIVRLAGPEAIAAVFRKVRTGEISLAEGTTAASDFRVNWQAQYRIVECDAPVADRAMILAEQYGLRGYDSVHLAAALELQDNRGVCDCCH